jgi:hypothetical protein
MMSYEEFAAATGIKRNTIKGYVARTGRNPPSMPVLYKIVTGAGLDRSFAETGIVVANPELIELQQRMNAVETKQPAAGSGRAPQDPADRPLADTAQSALDEAQGRTPQEPDAAEDKT